MPAYYLEFIWFRAIAQLRSESARAYLGLLWWALEPLLYLLVFYLVFAVVLSRGDEHYVQLLLVGLVTWKWFDSSVRGSMDVISHNIGLIDKVYLPKLVLPAVAVVANGIKFAMVLVLLLAFIAIAGNGVTASWLWLALLLPLQALFVFCCASLVAAITPFLPDLRLLFDKLMTFLFFLSGVFYRIDTVPESLQALFRLNPVSALIEAYRLVLIDGLPPQAEGLLVIFAFATVVGFAGVGMLRRFDRLYPRLIY